MNSTKGRNIIIGTLCVEILFMVAGFAAFQTNINIKGTSNITSNWDVKITNIESKNLIGEAANKETPTWEDLTATFKANLASPGDSISYEVTIANEGTLNATLDKISLSDTGNKAIKFTTKGINEGDIIAAGKMAILIVTVEYDSTVTSQPDILVNDLSISLTYSQYAGEITDNESVYLLNYDYQTNGGTNSTAFDTIQKARTSVDLSQKADKEGYEFIGWNTDKDAKEGLINFIMPEDNVTLYAIFKFIDKTAPIIDSVSATSTTNSITTVVKSHDAESGITEYQFSIDDGKTWVKSTSNTYTFSNLTANKKYIVDVRVTNGVGLQNDYSTTETVSEANTIIGFTQNNGIWSGDYASSFETQKLEFNFTMDTQKQLSFEWAISTDNSYYLQLHAFIIKDGKTIYSDSFYGETLSTAENIKYNKVTNNLEPGDYTLRFTFNDRYGQDDELYRAYIKNIVIKPISSIGITTKSITLPRFSSSADTVTITYPYGCGSTYKCSYIKDDGEEIEVKSTTQKVIFNSNGALIAKVSDKVNEVSSTYTYKIPNPSKPSLVGKDDTTLQIIYSGGCNTIYKCGYVINEEETFVKDNDVTLKLTEAATVKAMVKYGEQEASNSFNYTPTYSKNIKGQDINVVSLSDGLYEDTYEKGRYVYKGGYPHNYIKFNNEMWRIIAFETDGTIKIVKQENIGSIVWDETNKANWTRPATLNTYLNSEYYNSLSENAKEQIQSHSFGVGTIYYDNDNLAAQINSENSVKWVGNIGMISGSDYLRVYPNTELCKSGKTNHTYYYGCRSKNYFTSTMSSNFIFTITPANNSKAIVINGNLSMQGYFNWTNVEYANNIFPALYLKSDITLSGEGTTSDPYTIN